MSNILMAKDIDWHSANDVIVVYCPHCGVENYFVWCDLLGKIFECNEDEGMDCGQMFCVLCLSQYRTSCFYSVF